MLKRYKFLGAVVAMIVMATALLLPMVVHGEEERNGVEVSLAQDAGEGGNNGGLTLGPLSIAAFIAWFILFSFVVYQFQRQRKLGQELRRMSETLDALEKSGKQRGK